MGWDNIYFRSYVYNIGCVGNICNVNSSCYKFIFNKYIFYCIFLNNYYFRDCFLVRYNVFFGKIG